MKVILHDVNFKDQWCVDLDHMHMSGISNGGMLLWNIAAQVADGFGKFETKKRFLSDYPEIHIQTQ